MSKPGAGRQAGRQLVRFSYPPLPANAADFGRWTRQFEAEHRRLVLELDRVIGERAMSVDSVLAYRALLHLETDGSAPVSAEIQNDFERTVTWDYGGGQLFATASGGTPPFVSNIFTRQFFLRSVPDAEWYIASFAHHTPTKITYDVRRLSDDAAWPDGTASFVGGTFAEILMAQ